MQKIEENNRMGKTRDPFMKIRDTKGIFHAKVGTIKDRNNMDLGRRQWYPTPVLLPGKIPWTEEPGRLQSMDR